MGSASGPVLIAGYAEPSALIAFGTDTRFGNGADAAKLLGEGGNAVAIVSDDQADAFKAALDGADIAASPCEIDLTDDGSYHYARITLG